MTLSPVLLVAPAVVCVVSQAAAQTQIAWPVSEPVGGEGFDIHTGQFTGNVCVKKTEIRSATQAVPTIGRIESAEFEEVKSTKKLRETLTASAKAGGSWGAVSASARASFAQTIAITSSDIALLGRQEIITQTIRIAQDVKSPWVHPTASARSGVLIFVYILLVFVIFVAALALVTFSPIRQVRQPARSLLLGLGGSGLAGLSSIPLALFGNRVVWVWLLSIGVLVTGIGGVLIGFLGSAEGISLKTKDDFAPKRGDDKWYGGWGG